jgi:hypothetical protein
MFANSSSKFLNPGPEFQLSALHAVTQRLGHWLRLCTVYDFEMNHRALKDWNITTIDVGRCTEGFVREGPSDSIGWL